MNKLNKRIYRLLSSGKKTANETFGKPLELHDVLRALEKALDKEHHIDMSVYSDVLAIDIIKRKRAGRSVILMDWDLTKNLDQQDEKTKLSLAKLLE